MNNQIKEQINYPWVTFQLLDLNYCVSSQYIETMTMENRVYPLPGTPAFLRGVMELNKRMIPVVDMRSLLKLRTVEDELDMFYKMRQAHIDWVNALIRSVREKEPFRLAESAHQCTFGKWYDSYQPEQYEIRTILRKIDPPHEELHGYAAKIRVCGDGEKTENLLKRAEEICYQEILPLMDQLIQMFGEISRGITIVLEKGEKTIGALVDRVTAIRDFNKEENCIFSKMVADTPFAGQLITDGNGTVFLDLDVDAFMTL